MKKLDNKGFHLIMVPLIVILIGIIGFAGWYVWDANQEAATSENDTSKDEQPTVKPTPISDSGPVVTVTVTPAPRETTGWKEVTGKYGDQDYNFTYKVPADWTPRNYYPGIKPIVAATNFTKSYLLYVYDVTPQDIATFYNAFYVNGDTKPAPTNLSILQINGLTAYKFYIPGHGAAETTDTGTANILFYKAPVSQKVFGKAVVFVFNGGSAQEALADEILNLVASTFRFN
jgi:hypothetical protein